MTDCTLLSSKDDDNISKFDEINFSFSSVSVGLIIYKKIAETSIQIDIFMWLVLTKTIPKCSNIM